MHGLDAELSDMTRTRFVLVLKSSLNTTLTSTLIVCLHWVIVHFWGENG